MKIVPNGQKHYVEKRKRGTALFLKMVRKPLVIFALMAFYLLVTGLTAVGIIGYMGAAIFVFVPVFILIAIAFGGESHIIH
ncbi:MAG: hypothetical protein V4498_05335 [candidate division FCPU426 bacterium]